MNLSEEGIYVVTPLTKTSIDFIPGTTFELKFQIPSGEMLNLNCEVKWLNIHKAIPDGLTYNLGLEIIEPLPAYEEFFKDLYSNYMKLI